MTSVIWTTPLGLPIVQPYRQEKRKQIMTALQTVYLSDPNSPAAVNSMKQATAFPPNFVHSLDATHMMLTALECRVSDIHRLLKYFLLFYVIEGLFLFLFLLSLPVTRHATSLLPPCTTPTGRTPQQSTTCP